MLKNVKLIAALCAPVLLFTCWYAYENTLGRQVHRFAYATGYKMGSGYQPRVFSYLSESYTAEDAARDPQSFFTIVAMGVPGMPNGDVNPEMENILQRIAAAEPTEKAALIKVFVNSYNAGWKKGKPN